jgi:TPR repeat protein
MQKHVVGLIGLMFSVLPVMADPLNDALILYEGGHYAEAIPLLRSLADGGAIEAQLALFNIYNFGFGVPVDQATAIGWLSKAAKGGHPDALYNLGAMTLEGQGTTADPAKAVQLLYRAAELESPEAFYLLGTLSIQEAPMTGDIDTGLAYLARAAQLGQRSASAMLAVLLQEIPEVEHHLVKSAFHFQIAIDRGCNDLDDEAAQAMARLSPDDRALYDRSFLPNLAITEPGPAGRQVQDGPCLAQ